MLKGVNRRIIEVLNPEDAYFERIILFLNPDISPEETSAGAHTSQYLRELSQSLHPSKQLRKGRYLRHFCSLFLSALFGGGIVLFFFH